MTRHYLDLDALTKEGFICLPAYDGLFVMPTESHEVFYFSYETGEVRLVQGKEQEALSL